MCTQDRGVERPRGRGGRWEGLGGSHQPSSPGCWDHLLPVLGTPSPPTLPVFQPSSFSRRDRCPGVGPAPLRALRARGPPPQGWMARGQGKCFAGFAVVQLYFRHPQSPPPRHCERDSRWVVSTVAGRGESQGRRGTTGGGPSSWSSGCWGVLSAGRLLPLLPRPASSS